MNIVKKVDIGNVREVNQDYAGYKKISEDEAFLVVCDGMGGHQAGEVASSIAGDYILKHCTIHGDFSCEEDIKAFMYQLINEANREIYGKSLTDSSLRGMGTTVVLAYIKKDTVYVSHVGDSRAYLIGDSIEQITVDDTLVNALVRNGTITLEEAKYHPKKNILLQAVGVSNMIKVSFYVRDIKDKVLLICSDGLSNSLSDNHMFDIIHNYSFIEEMANQLLNQAKSLGGYDNICFVLSCKEEI